MAELLLLALLAGFFLALAGWLIILTSYHAYRRGYNPIVWAVAAIFVMNPIFLFVILTLAPNRSRLRRRERFRLELDTKLAGHNRGPRDEPSDANPYETRTASPRVQRPLDATQTYLGDD